jgi:hypothetical protein
MLVVASAINFLMISDGSAILRYSTWDRPELFHDYTSIKNINRIVKITKKIKQNKTNIKNFFGLNNKIMIILYTKNKIIIILLIIENRYSFIFLLIIE